METIPVWDGLWQSGDNTMPSVFLVDGTRIKYTNDTKIDGVLVAGSTVKVLARRDASGVLVAIEVVVVKAPADETEKSDDNSVTAISAG